MKRILSGIAVLAGLVALNLGPVHMVPNDISWGTQAIHLR